MRFRAARTLGLALAFAAPVEAAKVVTLDEVEQLRPFLPPEFWAHRDFFFYEGMQLEIGPAFRDYSGPPRWKEVTQKFAGQSKIGPENSLEGYTAGQPFVDVDCQGDPKAGAKIQYEWQCLGEMDVIAPMNTKVKAYPYTKDHNFGPYGLSYASDNWELRKAVKIRFVPHNADHPYHHKDIYLDKQTLEPMYSFAYDRKEELWKIIWHNHRWSEDDKEWYRGWEGIPEPRDLRVVSDTIVNVQTGTGNRIEFWDNDGMPLPSKGKIRHYIDLGRLDKGH